MNEKLRSNSQELDQGSAQNCLLFGVLQEWRTYNEVDRGGPVIRCVGPINDLADTEFSNQMSQTFFAKNHGIDEDLLLEIFVRMFLVGAIRVVAYVACHIRSAQV